MYIYMKNGHRGRGNHLQIEECILKEIRSIWPEPTGNYMGIKVNDDEAQDKVKQQKNRYIVKY